jgi:iron complex outermembrane receptor protein
MRKRSEQACGAKPPCKASEAERLRFVVLTSVLAMLFLASDAYAQSLGLNSHGLAELSLEELATIQVTSVSKRAQSPADAPSSIFVITGYDIRRSGASTLPEALRPAPNL